MRMPRERGSDNHSHRFSSVVGYNVGEMDIMEIACMCAGRVAWNLWITSTPHCFAMKLNSIGYNAEVKTV